MNLLDTVFCLRVLNKHRHHLLKSLSVECLPESTVPRWTMEIVNLHKVFGEAVSHIILFVAYMAQVWLFHHSVMFLK